MPAIAAATLENAFARTDLFADKTWRLSPSPFALSKEQLAQIEAIGDASFAFYRALETLYLQSDKEKSLLRNALLRAPWAAEWLDRGKPAWLIAHARKRGLKGLTPAILRPDLLITENGFALTELDSVPGGVGLTGFLGELYAASNAPIVGGADGMIEGFARLIDNLQKADPALPVAVAVSQEADTYRPEFEWLAQRLTASGGPAVRVCKAEDLRPTADGMGVEIDTPKGTARPRAIYRFFELFDVEKLPARDALLRGEATGALRVSPPMRAFQEEKLAFAFFHHPCLKPFWREALGEKHLRTLESIIPETWLVEPVAHPLPPHLFLNAPPVDNLPLSDWEPLINASQKQRDYILKLSGFNERAWGARSVTLGSDVPSTVWAAALKTALAEAHAHPYILQRFAKPARVTHAVYDDAGIARPMEGRARICPYYFVENGAAKLGGALATVCPADKKIIHGMSVAAMVPCAMES